MARPEIKIKIDGEGVSPETVRWVDLREIVSGIYDAVVATASANGIQRADVQFSLIDVKKSSDLIEIATDPLTHKASQALISAIVSRDDSELGIDARQGLEKAHRRLRQRNWELTFSRNGSPDTQATILPDRPLFDPPKNALHGSTSLLVQVVRVGGVRPSAKLRLKSGATITAQIVSREVAALLASKLYKTIQVHAQVTWNVSTKTIRDARITGVGNYVLEEAKPTEGLKRLHELSGGFWDTVSPNDVIREIRGE